MLAALALCVLAAPRPADASSPVVAVFDLESKRARLADDVLTSMSDYMATRLAVTGRYKVVPRSELKRALVAQKKDSYKQCYADACQIEIGKELAAEKSLASQVSKLGKLCIVTLTLYDLREAATDAAGTGRGPCSEEGVLASIDAALSELIHGARPPPRAAATVPSPSNASPSGPDRATASPPSPVTSPVERATPPAVVAPAVQATPSPPREGLGDHVLDPRRHIAKPRPQKLVAVELKNLERLLAATPQSSKDRPALLLRLGDGYAELAAASADRARREALQRSIDLYQQIVKAYPNDDRFADAMWSIALTRRSQRAMEDAEQITMTLLRKTPNSRHAGRARAFLGDLLFAETNASANTLKRAGRAYASVPKAGGPASVIGYAKYMSGHVAWRQGELEAARDAFTAAMKATEGDANPGAREVHAAARADFERITTP